jgi:hypothetical protein
MSNNSQKKSRSCTGRFFGTLFAFIAAAAVVYIGSYLVVFHMTGLPVANESGWLGPKMRFLATGPYQDSETASYYNGDTKPYEVFKPLNTAWLQTKDLPTTMPVAAAPEGERGDGEGRRGGDGEGRRGRGGRGARGEGSSRFEANERLDDSSTTNGETRESARETTGTRGSEEGERPRRRGNFRRGGEATDGGTTETAGEAQNGSAGEDAGGERPRRRGGRRGEGTGTQPE